jgi:ABC-type multidrug transport system fused ATPase/permease subunit
MSILTQTPDPGVASKIENTPIPMSSEAEMQEVVAGSRLRGVWRLTQGYRLPYFGAIISLAIATSARTGALLLIRYFVDTFLQGEATATLWMIVGGFLVLSIFQGGFTFLSGTLAAHTAESITRRLRNFMLDHIQRLPFTYHDGVQTGEMVQRVTSDIDAIRVFFASQAVESSRIVFLFLVNFLAIYWLSPQLAWISVVIIPVIIVVSVYFFRLVSTAYEHYQEQEAVLTTTLQENLSGVRVVKAFARQDFEENKFEGVNQEKYRLGKRLLLMHTLYWPISDVMCGIQMLVGFGVGAFMALDGTITVGTYVAYSGMLLLIIWPIRNLGRLVVDMSRGLVSFQRVAKIIRANRETMHEQNFEPPARLRGEIVFEDVSFAYRADEDDAAESASQTEVHRDNHRNGSEPASDSQQAQDKPEPAGQAEGTQHQATSHAPGTGNGVIRGKHSAGERQTRIDAVDGAEEDRSDSTAQSEPKRALTVALNGISFRVEPGQRVALLGAAGAGKTTLVNLLPRFYEYTGGRILLDSVELKRYSRAYLRSQIGIVEQEPFLFSRTVRDNITFSVGREVSQEEIEAAAKAAAIHDVIMTKLPRGYDTLVGERGTTLSGGQKQRVAIARTLLKDPRILILDDSTSAVDIETEASIREALERLMVNRTTFIIAHRIQSVMDADLILVLQRGRVAQAGNHDELLAQEGMYRRIFAAQTRIEEELQKELTRG